DSAQRDGQGRQTRVGVRLSRATRARADALTWARSRRRRPRQPVAELALTELEHEDARVDGEAGPVPVAVEIVAEEHLTRPQEPRRSTADGHHHLTLQDECDLPPRRGMQVGLVPGWGDDDARDRYGERGARRLP